ncbi:MAG: YeeE/YedE family protein [Magnetovibrio sp.]|nr:YeeE/YedE family protein [Magnetovibrio sp.]
MEDMSVTTLVASAGFIAGIVFGATANKTNFCTMGGVSDMVLMGDTNRFRAWMLAIAVAILGTQSLHMMEMIDLTLSPADGGAIYLTSSLGWPGAILGGLLFGYGMTMAGGCGNKTLVRLGAGNLKSIVVVLVMGVTAYMTLRGLFGLARLELEAFNTDLSAMGLESQSMVEMVAAMVGSETESLRLAVTLVFAVAIIAYCFKDAEFRGSKVDIIGAIIIGLLVPTGWYITGVLGADDFEPTPLFSFTFVAPSAESIQYLMTYTGSTINFGISAVGGVIVGSFLMAIMTKSFHIEAFSGADDMKSHMFGAVMMGIGGVLALGCTIGQGLTGMSTLALGSLIALASIIAGAVWGLKALEEGSVMDGLKAMFSRG